MKKRRILILFSMFIFSIILTSCQKPLSDNDIQYLGSWGSDVYSIEIWKNGRGLIEKKNQSAVEARVEIKNNQIKFKGGKYKTFDIDANPYSDANGNTIMILNGDIFYKH